MAVTPFGTCQHTCIKGIDEDILAKFQIAIAPSALAFTKSAALFSKAAMSTSDVAILEDAANDQLDVHAVLQDQLVSKSVVRVTWNTTNTRIKNKEGWRWYQ